MVWHILQEQETLWLQAYYYAFHGNSQIQDRADHSTSLSQDLYLLYGPSPK